MKYKLILFFVFFLLVLPSTLAAPPFPEPQTSEDDDLTIVYPKFNIYDLDCGNITLNFDVLGHNITKQNNDSMYCNYNVVDECGEGVISGDLTYNTSLEYWYFIMNASVVEEGLFNYYIYCNHTHLDNSTDGAFVSDSFIIKQDGYTVIDVSDYLIPLIIGLGLIGTVFIILGLFSFLTHEPKIKNREPRMEWRDLVSFLFIYMGMLIFVSLLHLITINTRGGTQEVMNVIFIVFLWIFVAALIFGVVGLIIQLLRWLVWSVNTPQ